MEGSIKKTVESELRPFFVPPYIFCQEKNLCLYLTMPLALVSGVKIRTEHASGQQLRTYEHRFRHLKQ